MSLHFGGDGQQRYFRADWVDQNHQLVLDLVSSTTTTKIGAVILQWPEAGKTI